MRPSLVMMGVLAITAGVARADVQLAFQGTLDADGCGYGAAGCPTTESLRIVLATPIVPDPIEVFGYTGPDTFVIPEPKYVSRDFGPASDVLFSRYGTVEGTQGFVTDSYFMDFSAPDGYFTGPITAPVLTTGVYLGASVYLAGFQAIYDGTVTISDVGPVAATPEPGTWGLVGTGLLGCVRVVRRRLV